jgi:glycosyltransferase involved in cell wall biosynthesis
MLSIVIPARNEETLIGASLGSLRNQKFQGEYEIIVVDNGSTDGTAKVAWKFGATVLFEPKPGVIFARQTGAAAAKGEIIIQADADTIYPPDWLSRIDQFFSSHSKYAALTGAYEYLQPVWWAVFEGLLRNTVNGIAGFFTGVPLYVSGANLAFRRQNWLQIGRYDPSWFQPDQFGITHHLHKFGLVKYDRKLIVHTSARRIDKPMLLLWSDIFRNLRRALGHYFGFLADSNKTR